MSEVYVARQPIFDRDLQVCGYELLYRGGAVNTAQFPDGDTATANVMVNTLMEMGLNRMTSGQPAYINLTRNFLVHESIPLPPSQIVLEVLEDIEPDQELIGALRRLSQQGYRIALDDYMIDGQARHRLLPFVDIVKVDISNMRPQEIVRNARALQRARTPKILAEKIETQPYMDLCCRAGFDYFQGFFLSRPKTFSQKTIAPNRLPLLNLVAALHQPELEVRELEQIIGQDLSLTYKLLRYLASPLFPTRELESIRGAILYLGHRQLTNWAILLAMTLQGDQPAERLVSLIVRARVCEMLTRNRYGGNDASKAFTVGLFSGLDAVLDAPIKQICNELTLSDELRQALTEHIGPYGRVIAAARAQEIGDWDALNQLEIPLRQINSFYIEALSWADQQWAWLNRSAAKVESYSRIRPGGKESGKR